MKYSGEGNVTESQFNRDSVFLVGSDDQLLIFHSCPIFSEFQLFWTLSERMLGGNFVWMLLHTILKTIFRFIYLEALSKYLTSLKNGSWTSFSHFLLQTFQRWSLCRVQVYQRFWPSPRLKHINIHQMFGPWQGPDIQNIFLWGPLYPLRPGRHFEILKSRQVFSSNLVNMCTVKK